MPGYFICQCCGRRTPGDPRVKIRQKYCGQKLCQQSGKNRWEKDRLKKDPSYRRRRNLQKSEWRKKHPAYQYQKDYREKHPEYVEMNREKQRVRNIHAQKAALEVMKSNIVKTDALIVELLVHRGPQKVLVNDSG